MLRLDSHRWWLGGECDAVVVKLSDVAEGEDVRVTPVLSEIKKQNDDSLASALLILGRSCSDNHLPICLKV